ncbi:MAG: hypothetical protein NZ483_07315, partial [Verrucomicrobiae bacterium]|nr:hypothetical protein [Verrucomicrobiae bacterium]
MSVAQAKLRRAALVWAFAWALVYPLFAQNNFNNNNTFGAAGDPPVTTNWGFGGLWSLGTPPASGQGDINITNIFLRDTTITNASGTGLTYLRIISGNGIAGTSNVTVITSGALSSTYGLRLGNKATLIIANTATFGSNLNQSFDLSGGRLVLSNASVFLNFNAASGNDGTIQFVAGSSQTADLNYAQNGGDFTNRSSGIIIKDGAGTGRFTGNFGGNNFAFVNTGTILVNSGTMIFDPRDAFAADGFSNAVSGRVRIGSGANFVINRTANAWNNDSDPDNFGVIELAGGTLTVQFDGSQASDRGIQNFGTIVGSGTLALRVRQSPTGVTIASNGVLNIFQTVAGNQQTFTSEGGGFGTFRAVSGGTLRINGNVASGMGGSWQVDSGGTLEVSSGVTVDLGAAFMPASQLNGTLLVNSGGAMTLASSTAGGPTLGQQGTFQLNPGANAQTFIYIPNASGLAAFTNVGAFVLTGAATGSATFQSGFGSGQNNYGFVNSGTIVVGSGGTLVFNSANAFVIGFSNTSAGVIIISNNSDMVIRRDASAWNGGDVVVTAGRIILNDGTLVTADGGGADATRMIRNLGTISTEAQSTNTLRTSVQNFGLIALTNALSELRFAGTGTASANASGGTIEVRDGSRLILTNLPAGTSLNFTNAGTIRVIDGTVIGGNITNVGTIVGYGLIGGAGVVNRSLVLASNLTANPATLTVNLSSFVNPDVATLGVLGTNTTLAVNMPGGSGQPLINQGTISVRGGTITLNGTATGVITNEPTGTIVGVGTVTHTVVNQGLILAANPIGSLNVFSVGLPEISTGTIGASNSAILRATITAGSGQSFINAGSISMRGGGLVIAGGAPGVITNQAWITGTGSLSPFVHNVGTIIAQVGDGGAVLQVPLLGGTNTSSGHLRAGLGATLLLSNQTVMNFGTIAPDGADGGTIAVLNNGTIVNRGNITRNAGFAAGASLNFTAFVQNENLIRVTNGVIAFSHENGLANTATITITATGTLQSNSSNAWANAGTIDMRGGTLRTGGFTNVPTAAVWTNTGNVNGFGTILGGGAFGGSGSGFDKSIANLGTIVVTNPLGAAAVTLTIDTGTALAQDGIHNVGNIIISSNNTLALNRQPGMPILNTGTITIQNGTLTGSGVISNTTGGIIQGYGTLTHPIVNLSQGTIRATNGLLVMSSAVHPINLGTLQVSAGATMTWHATNAWVNAGTIDMRGGTLRTGGLTNVPPPGGPFPGEPFTNLNYIVGFGTIIGGGAFGGSGPGFDKSILNQGTIIASGGTLILNTGVATANRGLANEGLMVVATTNDTLVLSRTAEISATVTNLNFIHNSGRILIHGGTLISHTSITNVFESAALPGLIEGFGKIFLTNQLVNLGTIRSTNTVAGGNGVMHFITDNTPLNLRQQGTLIVEGGSEMIFGTQSNAVLANFGTILMRGGTLRSGYVTNLSAAWIRGHGTITAPLENSGTLLATSQSAPLHLIGSSALNNPSGVFGASNGLLIVQAAFTNAGTVTFLNSVGTFHGSVVNQGAWIMDPSTNVFFGDFVVSSNGYITMTSGDVNIFKSNFVNRSYMSNQYDTLHGKFIFDGTGGHTQSFYVAGVDMLGSNGVPIGTLSQTNAFLILGPQPILGFTNNFALD